MLSKLKLIVGPQTSGKTEALLIDLRVAKRGNRKVVAFLNPDDEGPEGTGLGFADGVPSHFVRTVTQIRVLLKEDVEVVGIDSAERFGREVVGLCEELVGFGKNVVVTALELDDHWEPFLTTGNLLAIADDVQKLTGVCTLCRAPARFALRLDGGTTGSLGYELRCRACRNKVAEGHG